MVIALALVDSVVDTMLSMVSVVAENMVWVVVATGEVVESVNATKNDKYATKPCISDDKSNYNKEGGFGFR